MKRLMILLLSAVLLTCAACGKKDKAIDQTLNETQLVSASTQELIYKNSSYTLRFNKNEEDLWQWKDDTTIPLDQSKMQELLDQVSALNTLTPLADPGDITAYDLDAPDRTLEIKNDDGSSLSLQIGSAAEGGGYYMCRDGDTSKIYVVSDALVQMMDRNIYQLVQIPQIPVLAPEALVSIQVQGGDVSRTASRDGDGSWLCDTKDISAEVESFVALLGQGLALQSCVDYNPSSGAYPICGLTEPVVSVTVSYSSGKGGTDSFTLKLGLAYGDGYFAVYNDVPAIFKVSADTAATLTGLLTLGA